MQPLKALCYTVYALTVLEVLSVSCVNGLDQSSVAVEQRLDASDGFEPGCSVLDCGAFGGGKEDDTEAFRHCWRACSTVTVPAGEYLVAQLDLSGVGKQLRLLDGARLIAPGPEARDMYAFLAVAVQYKYAHAEIRMYRCSCMQQERMLSSENLCVWQAINSHCRACVTLFVCSCVGLNFQACSSKKNLELLSCGVHSVCIQS